MPRKFLYIVTALIGFSLGAATWHAHRVLKYGFAVSPPTPPSQIKEASVNQADGKPLQLVVAELDPPPPSLEGDFVPGVVVVYFIAGVDGEVGAAWVTRGDPRFRDQAVGAARQVKFKKMRRRGRFAPTAGIVIYKFTGRRREVLEAVRGPYIQECPD